MPPPKKAPTMQEVARAAACHPSTVSLALRGDPRIPAETQARVKAVAEKLGYRVNPLIAAWVSARRAGRPVEQRAAAAYLTCHPGDFRWQADQHFRSIFEGARDRAERYGFALTEFRPSDYAQGLERLNQVWVTRNVRGVNVPGVHENNRGIGRHAADLVVSLVLRNERGVPAMRQTVLVEPSLDASVGE